MKLERAIKFKNGKKRNYEIGNIPVYGGNGILGYTNNYNAEKNNIIIGRVGAYCGCVYKNDDECWISDNAIVGNVKEGFDYNFIYYLLKSINLNSLHIGSSHPLMTQEILNNIEINIPAYDYQKRAAKILNIIDQKIDLNNKTNDNLYKIIKTQYDKFINDIKEYELVKLKDIANVSSGKRPKIKGNEFDIPLIGASGVMAYTDNYNFNEDILIIGRVGTLGVVQRYFDKIWASDNTLTIKTEYSSVMECYLKTVDYISLNRGSTQPLITQTDISNLEMKFNKMEFMKFENEIKPLRNKIYQNELQNETLEQLRGTLLPKLMNGEIDLDKVEI